MTSQNETTNEAQRIEEENVWFNNAIVDHERRIEQAKEAYTSAIAFSTAMITLYKKKIKINLKTLDVLREDDVRE